MVKAIALHSVIPLRSEPSEAAEQLTQMLFVETCDVLQEQPRWLQVRLHDDQQTGWADRKMLSPITDKEMKTLHNGGKARIKLPMTFAVSQNNQQTIPLTAGTCLPYYQNGTFQLLGVPFHIDPQAVAETAIPLTSDTLRQTLRFFLNIPYLWGGKNAMGMDCSGFTQVIMSLFGFSLPRNASEQAQTGHTLNNLQEAKAGDLVFFNHEDTDPKQTRISHVGILLDQESVIHCSGRVKVEKITDNGLPTHHLTRIISLTQP